jgi:hypothetical protein
MTARAATGRERHSAAIANTLRWASDAARRGGYTEALEWLVVVEATGDELPERYQRLRAEWTRLDTADRRDAPHV